MITRILAFSLTLACATTLAAGFPGALKVTFHTMDCDGATGLANVEADHIVRVQAYTCPNGRRLKQVLARNPAAATEAYTISEDEAPRLEAELKRVQQAREKALEQTKPVVIERH